MPNTQHRPLIIKGKEFVRDIRSGMTDFGLSEKYGLTPHGFDRVLGYLVDAGLITKEELRERLQLSESQIVRAFVESRQSIEVVE